MSTLEIAATTAGPWPNRAATRATPAKKTITTLELVRPSHETPQPSKQQTAMIAKVAPYGLLRSSHGRVEEARMFSDFDIAAIAPSQTDDLYTPFYKKNRFKSTS